MKLFDGGMGTMLQRSGLDTGGCPDYYNLSHPDIVQGIHKAYADAGAEFITTNTFGSTAVKLSHYGLEDKVEAIAEAAVRNIRAACGDRVKVVGDLGPTGRFIAPLGDFSFDEAYDNFYRLAKALANAGADMLIIETIIDINEMRAALLAAKAAAHIPVICQMSYSEDGRTITGTDPKTSAILLDAMGADIIGANCSVGPDKLLAAAKAMKEVTNKPIIIQPNAGMPVLENGETHYPLRPEEFASYAKAFNEIGISYIGGCCGTTPNHIRTLRKEIEKLPEISSKEIKPFTALTSRTKTVFVGDDFPPVKIGERINPTGRKKMREDIQAGSLISVKRDALEQESAGAEILDVNMGVAGIDHAVMMEKAVAQISMLASAPLSIDSTDPDVLEAGVKVYPGRPLLNSVSASDPEKMEKTLRLAKKYGAAVLLLPLEKGNLPQTAEERVAIIRKILESAYAVGLLKEDLLLDPLVLTAGSNEHGARETLRTLQLYKREFGFPCVMGTSNVSFGLPMRPRLNATFLAMALAAGVNAPIVNPLDEKVKAIFTDARLLLGFDPGAKQFISKAVQDTPVETKTANGNQDPLTLLKSAVRQGEKDSAKEYLKAAVEAGISTQKIIDDALTAAMTEIGDGYGAGKVFLPQVMMAAEAMQVAFNTLKEISPAADTKPKGTFVIGTVAGDIHDLGKNIVAALMENSGYKVIDLGKDVAIENFIKTARTEKPDIIGLCSLMTTTLPELEETVRQLKADNPDIRIMAGGAVVTEEYAKTIGADAYAKDGIDAVRKADDIIRRKA